MNFPFKRRKARLIRARMIAYDLETTRIGLGTPQLRYITAFGEGFRISEKVLALPALYDVLDRYFLLPPLNKARFVAWNGNRYDVYFIALALMATNKYILRPYMTRSKQVRGLRVEERTDTDPKTGEPLLIIDEETGEPRKPYSWEFVDGLSMTVAPNPVKLRDFLKMYAPDYLKLELDFDKVEFDPDNPDHVAYAERDSEGLYHAMIAVEEILVNEFNVGLKPTIGNVGIKIFRNYIPEKVLIWKPPLSAIDVIRNEVLRGGYCHLQRKYKGPVWKYDLNQAYAAVMRNPLPSGRCGSTMTRNKKRLGIYKVRGSMPGNRIPFYVKEENKGVYARESFNSWITSPEYDQLEREGWALSILDGFEWTDFFTMLEYVDHLEFLRVNAPGGPKGPKGTMMKSIGCNSYGKTVEKLDGIEYVWAKECPVGYCSFIEPDDLFYEDPEALSINQFIWLKQGKEILREYHQPQLGSFITAYVRMMVRRAALMVPDAFLYADTDCCAFSQAVDLPLCEVKYGFWKLEVAGEPYGFIDKKVYYSLDGEVKHSKGIDRKKLTVTDFEKWFDGSAPVQNQIQKNNLLKVLGGEPMFRNQERKGSLYSGP